MCNILHAFASTLGSDLHTCPGVCAKYCMPIPAGTAGVDRSLLRDDVFRRLRDAIVDGTFAPGEQLRDGELATWLGVSRTPIREALLRLGTSGLVEAKPGRSTTVTAIDAGAARDARDVIAAMHALAVRQMAGRMSDADLGRMREANGQFADAVASGDLDAAHQADEELHRIPISALGNHALEEVIDHFDPLLLRAERQRFSRGGPTSVELHLQLIDLLANGDADGAAAVAFETWHSLPTEDSTDSES